MNKQAVRWFEDITHDTARTHWRLLESLFEEVCACAMLAGWTRNEASGWPVIRWGDLMVVFQVPPEAQGGDAVLIGVTVAGQAEPHWTLVYIPSDTQDPVTFLASRVAGLCRGALQQSPES